MKNLVFYEIMEWDSGNNHYPSGICFEDECTAQEYLKGNRYDTYQKRKFRLYSSLTDVKEVKIKEAKAKALAKLTEEERKLLGVEE